MSGFKCNLCLEEFTNQFKFFEHLKAHYDVISVKSKPILVTETAQVISESEWTAASTSTSNSAYVEDNKDLNSRLVIAEDLDNEPEEIIGDEFSSAAPANEKPSVFSCIKCKKSFKREKTYENHVNACQSQKKILIQGENFGNDENTKQLQDLMSILGSSSNDTPIGGIDKEITDEIIEKINSQVEFLSFGHLCASCDEYFTSKSKHDAHVKKCHPELGKAKKSKFPPGRNLKEVLKCSECDRIFNHRNSLVYHMRSHSGIRPHQCELCGKSFFATSALKVHKRLHSGEKPYKCDHCDRYFRQWGDLKYHVISIHSDIRQYQCEFCGKDFARKYSLIVHRRIHTGERNYKCEFCGKTFRAASYLQNHRRIHTGEKPHACVICSKPFRVRSDMKRHMTSHSRDHQPRDRQKSAGNSHSRSNQIKKNIVDEPHVVSVSLNSTSQIIIADGFNPAAATIQDGETIQVSLITTDEHLTCVNHEDQQSESGGNESRHNENSTLQVTSGHESHSTATTTTSIHEAIVYPSRDGSDTVTIRDTNSGTLYVLPVHFMH